ncbi:hypothetical protein [Halostagnicola sp. A-GB9-2]|uniref:hypothetical protein n=1 Tax=Halostagnicola sp. A-GB9-2 TaxID=3048066 RepID=UPI0024BF4BCC|nr:hypothetical protein [Halostagnicola sp. A-GB9-2]MDJ1432259.1 hypothetical protein [Halostagnicola sp. A-GB9-2]
MAAPLTDDDVGKTVVDAEGKTLGIVSSVENDTAFVNPNPSMLEQLLSKIGMEDTDGEDYTVTEDMLESVGEEIVLRGEI